MFFAKVLYGVSHGEGFEDASPLGVSGGRIVPCDNIFPTGNFIAYGGHFCFSAPFDGVRRGTFIVIVSEAASTVTHAAAGSAGNSP